MNNICSPLRYPGGKSCIFPFVSRLFYENDLIGIDYAEPFAGGCGLALRLMMEEYVKKIYINDFDPFIYAFWYVVLNNTDEFCRWIESVELSVNTWKAYHEIQSDASRYSLFELAQSAFFLNRTNVSGILKGGLIGGINQLGRYKIDARFNKKDLISRIVKVANFSSRITLACLDGKEFVKNLDRKKSAIFIYLDPPYYKKGAKLYMNFFNRDDHERLARQVLRLKKLWMVSYDNESYIKSLYGKCQKVVYNLSQCASNRVGREVLILDNRLDWNNSLNMLNDPVREV